MPKNELVLGPVDARTARALNLLVDANANKLQAAAIERLAQDGSHKTDNTPHAADGAVPLITAASLLSMTPRLAIGKRKTKEIRVKKNLKKQDVVASSVNNELVVSTFDSTDVSLLSGNCGVDIVANVSTDDNAVEIQLLQTSMTTKRMSIMSWTFLASATVVVKLEKENS